MSYAATTPASLNSSLIQIRAVTSVINKLSQFDITIKTPLPLPVGSLCILTIPNQISLYSDAPTNLNIALKSAVGYSPLSSNLQVTVISTSPTQQIQITDLVPDSTYYADLDQYVSFSILNLKTPTSLATTDTFYISFFEQQYSIMQQNGSIAITATAGTMTSVSVTPLSSQIRLAVPYTFSFMTSNNIIAPGKVQVQVPYEVTFNSGLLSLTAGSGLYSGASISSETFTNNRTLIISNAFAANVSTPTLVKFTLTGFLNPSSVKTIQPFVLSTMDYSSSIID